MRTALGLPGLFAILKPGVGPSSSHTLGPLRAGGDFRDQLLRGDLSEGRLRVTLLGSLARTGKGHLTDLAVAAGLAGVTVESDERPDLRAVWQALKAEDRLRVGRRAYAFDPEADIVFDLETSGLDHPNTMRFELSGPAGEVTLAREYHSIGGGAVTGGGFGAGAGAWGESPATMTALMDRCLEEDCSLADLAVAEQGRVDGTVEEEVRRGHEYRLRFHDPCGTPVDLRVTLGRTLHARSFVILSCTLATPCPEGELALPL